MVPSKYPSACAMTSRSSFLSSSPSSLRSARRMLLCSRATFACRENVLTIHDPGLVVDAHASERWTNVGSRDREISRRTSSYELSTMAKNIERITKTTRTTNVKKKSGPKNRFECCSPTKSKSPRAARSIVRNVSPSVS
eukprot:Amastigsp_a342490_8.p4 type:complete len:139 gc:universal Amastigsp_a342490_8:2042-1626(-)